jgi:hypothetical protein
MEVKTWRERQKGQNKKVKRGENREDSWASESV